MGIFTLLGKTYQILTLGLPPNLLGDRDIEYAFVAAFLPQGGNVLDFGSGTTPLSLISFLKGAKVTAVDLLPSRYKFQTKIKFLQGDILKISLNDNQFDTIINCSSIEHVGLAGRYGVSADDEDGDLKAMSRLYKLLKKNGKMLLTIPVGKDQVQKPKHRIYGKIRLPMLLEKFQIEKQIFWAKTKRDNLWKIVSRKKALSTKYGKNYYNIGCFVLIKRDYDNEK
jgi:SAM-dependent methyltransferase